MLAVATPVPTSALASFGALVLLFALVAACFSAGAAIAGARIRRQKLIDASVYALYAVAALTTIASITLSYAILTQDYTIKYVAHYSDSTMPIFYKLTSLWGGLDGSILFWVWLLSLFSALAVFVNRKKHRELIGYVVGVLMTIATFFLLLIVFWGKNPFTTFLTEPPLDGKGLNPLLQTYWMAIHPPSLYLGYVGMSIPFAFCISALLTGNLDDAWLSAVRRWVLFAWFFLSLGLVLGMIWAYEELGWGGIWAWDPVENAGLLPWLTATAFLHSVMIQERRGMFRIWNVSLMITTFFLTIFGTFMTRSGIVQSVHAFGEDNELAYLFLIFMALLTVFSFGLLFFRLPQLRSGATLDSWLSREFMFLTNNWILLSAAFFVLFATMFPTLAQHVTGDRITVGQEFFNLWMIPLGLLLLLLTGIGPLIAWKKATARNLQQQFLIPVVTCFIVVVVLAVAWPWTAHMTRIFSKNPIKLGGHRFFIKIPAALICFGLCGFTLATIVQEFWRGTRVRKRMTKTDPFTALVGLTMRNRRRYAGYIVHVGIVLMFFGFAGHAFKTNVERTLRKGESTYFGPYKFVNEGFEQKASAAMKQAIATIGIFEGGTRVHTAMPEKRLYAKSDDGQPTTEVALWRRPQHDVYVVLTSYNGDTVNLNLFLNPLLNWVWFGFGILALGTFIVMLPDSMFAFMALRDRERNAPPGPSVGARVTSLLVLVVGSSVILYGTKLAFGQGANPPDVGHAPAAAAAGGETETGAAALPMVSPGFNHNANLDPADSSNEPRTDTERRLFSDMVCMCRTCGRQTVRDCKCTFAAEMRSKIRDMLAAGATYDDVMDGFKGRYGDEVLVEAPGGLKIWNWLVPVIVITGALAMLAAFAFRLKRRARARALQPATAGARPPLNEDDEERLEDELSQID